MPIAQENLVPAKHKPHFSFLSDRVRYNCAQHAYIGATTQNCEAVTYKETGYMHAANMSIITTHITTADLTAQQLKNITMTLHIH